MHIAIKTLQVYYYNMKTKRGKFPLVVAALVVFVGTISILCALNWPKPETTSNNSSEQPTKQVEQTTKYSSEKGVSISVTQPVSNQIVASPVAIVGKVPGSWSFEASFPVQLIDANGKVVASGHASIVGDWMTEKPVPFTATLTYEAAPTTATGFVVLKKDNPSGMSEHDDSLKIPVKFGE